MASGEEQTSRVTRCAVRSGAGNCWSASAPLLHVGANFVLRTGIISVAKSCLAVAFYWKSSPRNDLAPFCGIPTCAMAGARAQFQRASAFGRCLGMRRERRVEGKGKVQEGGGKVGKGQKKREPKGCIRFIT